MRKGRGRRGALKLLFEMPLDILFEILQLLHPLDLIHLTRTAKAVRRILYDQSAISVWKQARHTINGLPECPDDISEPYYAALLFEKHCQQCLSKASQICWEYRTRWCQKCVRGNNRSV
ncbi:hypothetical protein BDQ17DRAFT_1249595 [Cyathus striatus]|nr:hypothetical protein BDQ17DRAFT_1249595 [Cyathus striatus]